MVTSALLAALPFLPSITSLASHSPPDLYAYPKYSVSLSSWDNAINNLTATAILDNLRSEAQEQPTSLVNPNSFSLNNKPNARHTLMRTASGQAFLCALPPLPSLQSFHASNTTDSSTSGVEDLERKKEREQIEKQGLKNGLSLISSLKDRCIYTRSGWFTYSFCYGKGEIRQFHAQVVPGYNFPQEDPNQDVYVLGLHLDHPQNPHHQAKLEGTLAAPTLAASEGELTSLGRNRFSPSGGSLLGSISDVLRDESVIQTSIKQEEEFQQKRYLVQRWDGGTICDMTGKPRSVEVQFHCSTIGSDHIALLRETTICEYLLVIHTPRLCSEPLFLDGGSRRGIGAGELVTKIGCQPVLTDEEIEKWKASENARTKKRQDEEKAQQLKSLEETSSDQKAETSANNPNTIPKETSAEQGGHAEEPSSGAQTDQAESLPTIAPDQTVLGGSKSTSDSTTGKTDPQTSGNKADQQLPNSKAKQGILEVEPITVFFNTDTGKVYVDNPAAEKQPSSTGSSPGTTDGTNNQASNSQESTTDSQSGSPVEQTIKDSEAEFQEIAKALKASLSALLKDLRVDDDTNNQAARRPNQNQPRSRSLAEVLASLKEMDPSSSGSMHKKLRILQNNKNDQKQRTGDPKTSNWEDLKKLSSESHSKLVEMYQQKFDVSDDHHAPNPANKKEDEEKVDHK